MRISTLLRRRKVLLTKLRRLQARLGRLEGKIRRCRPKGVGSKAKSTMMKGWRSMFDAQWDNVFLTPYVEYDLPEFLTDNRHGLAEALAEGYATFERGLAETSAARWWNGREVRHPDGSEWVDQ